MDGCIRVVTVSLAETVLAGSSFETGTLLDLVTAALAGEALVDAVLPVAIVSVTVHILVDALFGIIAGGSRIGHCLAETVDAEVAFFRQAVVIRLTRVLVILRTGIRGHGTTRPDPAGEKDERQAGNSNRTPVHRDVLSVHASSLCCLVVLEVPPTTR